MDRYAGAVTSSIADPGFAKQMNILIFFKLKFKIET
jgi:hypothetical protein